jgi:CheY-like chemotaxis protein
MTAAGQPDTRPLRRTENRNRQTAGDGEWMTGGHKAYWTAVVQLGQLDTTTFWHKHCCLMAGKKFMHLRPVGVSGAVELVSKPQMMDSIATKTKTILYVEDDPVVLTAYGHRLEKEGFSVVWAKDGLEAMKVLLQLIPDLVVLDLMLPRFDGTEVMKFMQANPRFKTIPVIILATNSIVDANDESVLECASQRFIKDRCTFPMILQAVRQSLGETPVKDAARPSGRMDNLLRRQPKKTVA